MQNDMHMQYFNAMAATGRTQYTFESQKLEYSEKFFFSILLI